MPLPGIEQPEIIPLTEKLRLKKYDGHYEKALAGYQDPMYTRIRRVFLTTARSLT